MRATKNDKLIRCAVYTRKSHEEGLDQEFNSLDAQRESAEAYIKSQQHEGWQLIETQYDDGGFSGGNMKRPALTKLLEDILYNKIDIVVVYKVDRLSRSLSDFSRLVELFDEHSVSFVSVTQQFNTSNSMGRLTLNMLLSFAQFEREVTGERIRDKIEASKKKGLWMGGNPPMGYAVEDRRLIVLPDEAAFVKRCFESYLSTPSILTLAQTFNDEGYRTKYWVSQKGKTHGGKRLSPKYVYRILTNPVYRGQITHKAKQYDGQHEAIIEQVLWDRVQENISKKPAEPKVQTESPYLLKGKFKHYEGYSMSPSTFKKKHKNGDLKQTRYYVSQKAIKQGYGSCVIKSVNAEQIENIVVSLIADILTLNQNDLLKALEFKDAYERTTLFRNLVEEVWVSPSKVSVILSKERLSEARVELAKEHIVVGEYDLKMASKLPMLICRPQYVENTSTLVASINIEVKKVGRTRTIVDTNSSDIYREHSFEPSPHTLAAFRDAHRWRAMLEHGKGKSAKQIARERGINYMTMLRRLTLLTLSPEVQMLVIGGGLKTQLSLKQLLEASASLNWSDQSLILGLR